MISKRIYSIKSHLLIEVNDLNLINELVSNFSLNIKTSY